ncbi:MAG TPA: hypothetical protein VL854_04275 [Nitrososphaeraceae archaeon]|nr:hypothetical protein [Nitrososphaeraceae archaeon]
MSATNPKKTEANYDYNPDDEAPVQQVTGKDAQPKTQWETYLDSLDQSRLSQTIELAKLDKYTFNGKTYDRKKIKNKQFFELERLRAKFAKEKDQEAATEHLINVYVKCAEYYLGMSAEEYDELDWEDTKPILDACNFRSVRGLPSSPKDLKESGGIT